MTATTILRLEGAAVLSVSVAVYVLQEYSLWLFALLLLAPDVFMVGYIKDTRLGARIYNIGHSIVAPILIAGIGFIAEMDQLYAIALIWLAHIGMDRMFGYGLKHNDDFKHTHLGWIGGKLQK